jgi:hypothetical protein
LIGAGDFLLISFCCLEPLGLVVLLRDSEDSPSDTVVAAVVVEFDLENRAKLPSV